MKILFVNEYDLSRPVSGAEYSQMALVEGLRAVGQAVEIFSPGWKKNQPGRELSPLWFNNLFYYLYSAWQISRQKFDLIHVHGKYILPGAVMAGWLMSKPVVVTVRDFKFLCPLALCFTQEQEKCTFPYFINHEISEYQKRYAGGGKFKLILAKLWQYQLKWWLNRCQKIIAVSPQLAQIYRNNGVKKVTSIYNLPPGAGKIGQGSDRPIILSVGRLSYGKGTDVLIEVFKKLKKRLPAAELYLAGNKTASFQSEFPDGVRYFGSITHAETLKLYSQAQVFTLLSRWPEPLSRAGLEALSFGLPIVASDRGGNQELIQENGYLVDIRRPQNIAGKLYRILSDKKQRIKFSAAGLKLLARCFNRDKIIKSHLALYQEIIHQ